MATITRGKLKGTEVKIHQFCNDWITVKEDATVLNPLSVQVPRHQVTGFAQAEVEFVAQDREGENLIGGQTVRLAEVPDGSAVKGKTKHALLASQVIAFRVQASVRA